MKYMKLAAFSVFVFFIFATLFLVSALSDTMTVEANIITNTSESNNTIIRVEVPDYLFIGNVSVGEIGSEMKIYVNNTGNVDITVTPRLLNNSEDIFSYLHFRKLKTSNGTDVPLTRIGDFDFDISKPSSGNTYNDEYFYMVLDLRNYSGTLNNDIMRHRADVKFFAVQK